MGPAITEVLNAVRAQGVGPAGPLFSHHFRMRPDVYDFEVGVPVSAAVVPTGRVIASELPAVTVVRATYQGNYDGLAAAWGQVDAWLKSTTYSPADDLWETYVAGPESGPDPSRWRTELNRPLR
jgi:effector-binding domain-containing protein